MNNLIFKGIQDGKQAFAGPHIVQLDLTGRCNANCIGCWVHSPLIDDPPRDKNKALSLDKVKELISDFHRIDVKKIFLSGSGEPLLHPQILEIVTLIKEKGFKLNLITNGLLLDKEKADLFVKLGVDTLTVSLWAATPKTYLETHPSNKEKDFFRIKDNLKSLSELKKKTNRFLPHLKIYNVICSLNYDEIDKMVELAADVQAEMIEFQVVDIVNERMAYLSLSKDQAESIKEQFQRLREDEKAYFKDLELIHPSFRRKDELREFPRRFVKVPRGFSLQEKIKKDNENIVTERYLECPCGYKTFPSGDNPLVNEFDNKLIFTFPWAVCKDCLKFRKECIINSDYRLTLNYLGIYSFGSFMRRISSVDIYKNNYDQSLVNDMSCLIGWYYSRVLSNGDVIPCCKAARLPLGNINKDSFSQIWNSQRYQEFRYKAKNLPKTDIYFSAIGCLKGCDNWSMNLHLHRENKEYNRDKEPKIPDIDLEDNLSVVIKASDFIEGDFNKERHNFGKGIVIDGGKAKGYAKYSFCIKEAGLYQILSCYASGKEREVRIYLDNNLMKSQAMNKVTGGWTEDYLNIFKEFKAYLKEGEHHLSIYSDSCIPHLQKIYLKRKKKKDILAMIKDNFKKVSLSNKKNIISKFVCKKYLFQKIYSLIPKKYLHRGYRQILGVFHGSYGYRGPFHVQIDLTNDCNNNCIACWCNSPLYKIPRLSSKDKAEYLPTGMVKELLDQIVSKGATEVYYSGSGEPFMHPQIMEILAYTKEKGLICHVNTNFTLIDKEKIDSLIDIGVDFLTVSTWAGTPKIYAKTHPNKREEDFLKIKDNLIYLNTNKKSKPFIKLYNVLFNMNYFEMQNMIDFARETKSESLEFTLADTIPGVTDVLVLNKQQSEELAELCKSIQLQLDSHNRFKGGDLSIFQFSQFLRRISVTADVEQAKYDRNIIDSMPCYIGWLFARVIPNGQVHSCLKAHRIPTGSLYQQSFFEIWNSDKQKTFRRKTNVCKKQDPFFKLIGNDPDTEEAGCYKSCDDIGRNMWMHRRINSLGSLEKFILKSLAKTKLFLDLLKPNKDNYKSYSKDKSIAGIKHGRKAFTGPEQVVIDPTNKCNLRCSSCWLYSPYLTKSKPSDELINQELPTEVLIGLIDDLSLLGTERIRFTGGGEPFMHKDLMKIIQYSCKRGLLVGLTTNLGLICKKDLKRLIDLQIEELCVSLWASNEKIYKRVHPGVSDIYFEKIKENLLFLKESKTKKPRVTFANVITKDNYKDFYRMYDFGKDYGADGIYFTLVDILKGETDRFLLSEKEREELKGAALSVKESNLQDDLELEFFDGFLNRLSQSQKDIQKGEYDKDIINRIPCYAGWIFSRILANGEVAPCCRGVKKVMGNIKKDSFKDVWFSSKYNEFRARAKYQDKKSPYFKDIGCIKECDNLMHNITKHKELGFRI